MSRAEKGRTRVGLVWAQFGPYHVDRCAAVGATLRGEPSVLCVEVASASATYSWEPTGDIPDVEKRTLFPNQQFESLGTVEKFRSMRRALAGCDIVFVGVAYSDPAVMLLSVALRLKGVRVVVMTESKFDDLPRGVVKELGKALVLMPYSGALVGGARQEQYVRFLGFRRRPVWVGYDTVSIERVRSDASHQPTAGLPFSERPFICVARLVEKKNLEMLVKAYARYAAQTGPGARRLVILGDGPLAASLSGLIRDLGVADRVELAGFVQGAEVARRMAEALALLLISTEEQWGLVVNEALALGLPVIVSDQVGARDSLVRNLLNGFVVPADDPEAIAKALSAVGEDLATWTRMSAASLSLAERGDTVVFGEAVADATRALVRWRPRA